MALGTEPGLITSPLYRPRTYSGLQYPDPALSPEDCPVFENMNKTRRGTFARRNGFLRYNSTQITESSAAKAVTGIAQPTFKSGTTVIVETAGTKVYTDDGTTRSDITGSLTLTNNAEKRLRSTFIQDQLIATNGLDETWKYTGSGNASALAGVPWTTCADIMSHRNLLVAMDTTESGTRYPTRVRWPDITSLSKFTIDITTWPTDNFYEVYPDGAAITGGVDAFGRVLVFKRDGMYPLRFDSSTGFIEATMVENEQVRGIDFIAKNSIIARPEFAWAVARDGMYRIEPNGAGGFKMTNVILPHQEDAWVDINKSRLQYAVSWFRDEDTQVRTLISGDGNNSGHDEVWVYDWSSGQVWIEKPADSINVAAQVFVSDVAYDFQGTVDGYVNQADNGTSDNGTSISFDIEMAPNDCSQTEAREFSGKKKDIVNIITEYREQSGGLQTVNLSVDIDQGTKNARTTNLTLGTSLTWDSGLSWDSGLTWPGGTNGAKIFFVNRLAETIAPRWQGSDNFELIGYRVQFRPTE